MILEPLLRIYQNHQIAMLVDSEERRSLKNFYKMMKPTADSPDEHKSHFNRLGNLILIHINIAQDGSNSLQQYEAEWMNGTSLEISEKFDFDRPGCPNTKNGQPFKDFKCFDYLKDTIMTTTRRTTTTQPPPVTVRVPPQEIGF